MIFDFEKVRSFLLKRKYRDAILILSEKWPDDQVIDDIEAFRYDIVMSGIKGTRTPTEITVLEAQLADRIRNYVKLAISNLKKVITFFNNDPDSTDLKLTEESKVLHDVFAHPTGQYVWLGPYFHLPFNKIVKMIGVEEPEIVQMTMHGDKDLGLKMKDENENRLYVGKDLLYTEIKKLQEKCDIHVLLLNGCHTLDLAKHVKELVPYVIGTNNLVGDRAARIFSSSFYEWVTSNKNEKNDITKGFHHAVSEIRNNENDKKYADVFEIA